MPVWTKLTPSTTDIAVEAGAAFRGGADAITSSNTFPSIPLVDPETLEFEMNVDGYTSSGGLGGPAILPLALAKMAQMTHAFPDKSFSGIGGISDFSHALNYFLLGCGTVQVCTAAMLDHAIGPNVIRTLKQGMTEFLEKNAAPGLDVAGGLPRPEARPRRSRSRRSAVRIPASTTAVTRPRATRRPSRRRLDPERKVDTLFPPYSQLLPAHPRSAERSAAQLLIVRFSYWTIGWPKPTARPSTSGRANR